MTLQELRNQLNQPGVNLNMLITSMVNYLKQDEIRNPIINNIASTIMKKGHCPQIEIYNIFFNHTYPMVDATRYFTTRDEAIRFLIAVYGFSMIRQDVVNVIQTNTLKPVASTSHDELDTSKMSKEELGKLKAAKMREAKAKKKLEQELKEATKKKQEQETMRSMVRKQPINASQPVESTSISNETDTSEITTSQTEELTPEQIKKIKNLSKLF